MISNFNKKTILIAPLNWGLGHATRCIPIIKALIENNNIILSDLDIEKILTKNVNFKYNNFIEKTFENIYYTEEENKWLDIVIQNIQQLSCEYKKAIAYWALFQSCIIKRPYNLFHRKNLHIRMADVKRTFGNKTTWDKPFDLFFKKFVKEANAAIFDNHELNKSINLDIFAVNNTKLDLVYIDPPYIPKNGSLTTYEDFYHFLNGIVDYDNWYKKIDYDSKHLKLKTNSSIWENKKEILSAFEKLFNQFKDSIIIVSYREDGIPSVEELTDILKSLNKKIEIKKIDYKYALANKNSKEVLIIAK